LGKVSDREAPLRQGQRYCIGKLWTLGWISAGQPQAIRCSLKRSRSVTTKIAIA